MSVFVKQNSTEVNFNSSNGWVILSPIEQSIKRKIETVGIPLRDWNVNIYRGILTGYNDAFIIDGATKNDLIRKDPKSAEIIRPILRGRDIKRYDYDFADLWLIATFPSKKYNIDDYPAIKNHLLMFGKERLEQTGARHIINGQTIVSRKKTMNQWFETQDSIGYWDDFSKQKIVWSRLTRISSKDFNDFPRFTIVEQEMVVLDSLCFFTGDRLKSLVHLLNSEYAAYYFYNSVAILDNGGMQMRQQYVENIPIPNIEITDNLSQSEIDQLIYGAFQFNKEEISFIKTFLLKKKSQIKNH